MKNAKKPRNLGMNPHQQLVKLVLPMIEMKTSNSVTAQMANLRITVFMIQGHFIKKLINYYKERVPLGFRMTFLN
jgi:hypothetical protein